MATSCAGDVVACIGVVGLVVYSLGMNIPLGLGGAALFGTKALIDKVALEKLNKPQEIVRKNKLCLKEKSLDRNSEKCRLWAISAIPLIGPTFALGIYYNKSGTFYNVPDKEKLF